MGGLKRPIRASDFVPKMPPCETTGRMGGGMPNQLGKSKPVPDRNAAPTAGEMCWETDVTPKPAHSMWDEDAITQRFARRDSDDITQKVIVDAPCCPGTLWKRLRNLFARLF